MDTTTQPTEHAPGRAAIADRIAWAIAVLLHVTVAVFPISATGLVAPLWFIVLTWFGWLLGAVVLWRGRRRPRLLWLVPVGTVGLWWAAVTAGGAFLGWTA